MMTCYVSWANNFPWAYLLVTFELNTTFGQSIFLDTSENPQWLLFEMSALNLKSNIISDGRNAENINIFSTET